MLKEKTFNKITATSTTTIATTTATTTMTPQAISTTTATSTPMTMTTSTTSATIFVPRRENRVVFVQVFFITLLHGAVADLSIPRLGEKGPYGVCILDVYVYMHIYIVYIYYIHIYTYTKDCLGFAGSQRLSNPKLNPIQMLQTVS